MKPNLIHHRVLHLPRHYKRALMLFADFVMIPLALWSAFGLMQGHIVYDIGAYESLFILAPVVSVLAFSRMGLYRAVVRYMGAQAAFAVLKGVSITTIVLMLAVTFVGSIEAPRTVFAIFWLIAVLYVGGSRFFVRAYFHWLIKSFSERQLVAIYGAGGAGLQLASALSSGDAYIPVAFIDDNPSLQGSEINGIQIYSPADLDEVIPNLSITQVMLAVPSIGRPERQAILNRLEQFPVYVRTVPSMPDLVSGQLRVDELRDVELEDLLGRDAVPPDDVLLSQCIAGKTVMVTGAAGSIGSELCRQILSAHPKMLLLLEISEFGLYNVEKELRAHAQTEGNSVKIVPLLASVQSGALLEKALAHFKVDVIFHAAAYKHVPMVEHNIIAGVRNNVFGTLSVAQAAAKVGVSSVVLISTDKAVRSANVMGATKRLAELILQGLAVEYKNTCFSMVRFGNVLGSSGSVVPLFRRQIQQGGPVTVTHTDVSRYFMTIREAAQLVLQSVAIAKGGDVFVLDMGERVNISDLARKMIHLMGYEVKDDEQSGGEIEISYTGLRPGEKLTEELYSGENLSGTEHHKILRAEEEYLPWVEVQAILARLDRACVEFDYTKIRDILISNVIGFKPQHGFVDSLYKQTLDVSESNKPTVPAKVTKLYPGS